MRDPVYGWFHPGEIVLMQEIEESFKRTRRSYLLSTSINQRFRDLLSRNCTRVSCKHCFLDSVFCWKDAVVFEIDNIVWDDVPGSDKWLWYWRRAYVVDSKRSRGVFREFCEQIMNWADCSGIAFCLVASSFGFDLANIDRPNWLGSVEEVACAWNSELTDIRPDDWLVHFYRSLGFKNAFIGYGDMEKDKGRYPIERSFVYVGKQADSNVFAGVRTREMLGLGMK